MNGNHLRAIRSSMFPRVIWSRMVVKSSSTSVWTRFGLASIRLEIHSIVPAVRNRRDEEVEDRLVDAERPEVDPGVEPELVLRRELVVVTPGEAEDEDREEERAEVGAPDGEEDFPAGGHDVGVFLSSGRRIRAVARWTV